MISRLVREKLSRLRRDGEGIDLHDEDSRHIQHHVANQRLELIAAVEIQDDKSIDPLPHQAVGHVT